MNTLEATLNGKSKQALEELKQKQREMRRLRNFDRAVMIVSTLMFEGMIKVNPDCDLGDIFEVSVDHVLKMLEMFDLDSPNGDIVDIITLLKK